MADVTIQITANGPSRVKGPIALTDHNGETIEVAEGKSVFLCRCGGSTNKPEAAA